MSHIEIKKAKVKSSLFLSYEYVEKTEDHENKISTSSDAPIHDDLKDAFKALVPFFAYLTENAGAGDVNHVIVGGHDFPEPLEKFKVTGFTIGGSGDTEGVVISGYKQLESGKVVNFNTPFQKFDDAEFDFSSELYTAIDNLRQEVHEYMDGKQAPRKEVGQFDFGEEEDESFKMPEDGLE